MTHFHIAIALIWHDEKILVTQRSADAEHLPNLQEFPGGKCEDGETPRDCAVREVREEVGLEIRIIGERTPFTYDYPQRRVTIFPFDCEIVSSETQALQVADLLWLRPHELRIEDFPAANIGLIDSLKS